MSKWPMVELKEILYMDLEKVYVQACLEFPMVGVLSYGRGLFDRESIVNGQTSYKYFYRLKNNQFVFSQLFGWEGAMALCTNNFIGKYVSPQFPTFTCDEKRLDPKYLEWYSKLPSLWKELGTRTTGMGDRRRNLTPEALLKCKIPLPPLSEQRRLVEHIDALASKIEEAKALREKADIAYESMISSLHCNLAGNRKKKLGDLLFLDEERITVIKNNEYPQVGVRGFGRGLFARESVFGYQTTYKSFNKLHEGQLILSQVKGWEGAVAICPSELHSRYVSPEYRTFTSKSTEVDANYLTQLIPTHWFWSQLSTLTRGVGARRERISPEMFLELEIPMPTLTNQEKGIMTMSKVASTFFERALVKSHLDVIMGSVLNDIFST